MVQSFRVRDRSCKVGKMIVIGAWVAMSAQGLAQGGAELEKIAMKIGEIRSIAAVTVKDIEVSRRGVVSVYASSDGAWQMVALQRGLVILTGFDEENLVKARWLVEVRAVEKDLVATKPSTRHAERPPAWLCQAPGIHCDGLLITGTANSNEWLKAAQAACKKISDCIFLVSLKARYKLSARVLALEKSAAQQLGFAHTQQGQVASTMPLAQATFESRLQDLKRDSKVRVLSEPVIRLLPNFKAEVISGGEFQVLDYRDDHSHQDDDDGPLSSWKRHGLQLSVVAAPLDAQRAQLEYQLDLRSKVGGNGAALSVNSTTSQIVMNLGVPQIVSLIDLQAHGARDESTHLFSKIPVIGPLFGLVLSEASHMSMGLWFLLTEDQDAGEFKGQTQWPEANLDRHLD